MDLQDLRRRLVAGDAGGVKDLVGQALNEGVAAQKILADGLIPGMSEVGERFERNEYFVPELLLAARAMYTALDILRPRLAAGDFEPAGRVVMGTVQGDLHDIGKKLCVIMLEGNGYEVTDLGADVAPERFVEAVKETGARLVGLSSLLTTTMPAMQKTIRAIREFDPSGRVRVIIGGAPVTQEFAASIGADGFGRDANAAVSLVKRLIGASSG
jgi:5-methyltetrahydrofolate--homocysteine methyltransferase